MKCDNYKEDLSQLITGYMDPSDKKKLLDHLAACPDCRMEFETMQKIWSMMGEIPMPSPSSSMQTGFNAMLENFKQEAPEQKSLLQVFSDRLKGLWNQHPMWQFAYSVIILIVGLGIGYFSNRDRQTTVADNKQIDSLSSQVSEMKQMIMLSLLENPSASERMRAVNYTDQISSVNKKVMDALFTTLNEDANVNVRLVTLETLVKLSGNPGVREGLVQSIIHQDSPLLQSAMADVMVKLQEKKSIKSFQQLLNKKDLNEMVRIKIEQSIHRLI
ncbi:MAG TPA: hypothetical protein VHZ50_11690 [Puia sp.]|nr:hypothetical protein [Puia sp.]